MKITYWIVIVLLCPLFLYTGYMDITHKPQMVAVISSLGYPEYFLTMDGTAKFLAVLALLIPGFATLREWAYAGITFLTIGAAWPHLANHQNPSVAVLALVLTQASCWLWRRMRVAASKN